MALNFKDINFHIVTFGCQMNKHDSERICGMLETLGASAVDSIDECDIVLYLTCCVREAADVRLYGQASSIKNVPLRKGSPLKTRILAIGGCIGQRDSDKLKSIVGNVDVVFGTHNIGHLPALLEDSIEKGKTVVEVLEESSGFPTDLPTHREKP